MLSFLIALLAAVFLWEVAAIKTNLRLAQTARKRLFRMGGRFAIVALLVELVESTVPETGLSPLTHAAWHALLMAAIPEELIKFLAVTRFGKRELSELGPSIAVLMAVGTSLGFGVLESQFSGGGVLGIFTALPMDAIFGFTMGGFLALAWNKSGETNESLLLMALLVPMAFHFLFTFLLVLHQQVPALIWPLAALPAVMLLEGGFALILTNHAVNKRSGYAVKRPPFDPYGTRARQFAMLCFALTGVAMALAAYDPHLRALGLCAVLPLLFMLDLGLVAMARSRGYA
ncbi:PrsW family glutamic-type intramembrane protease [Acidocella aminolytica]|uniref:Uncharacterized protein n=1 Tax=Acidocella aminolytica 101 = DSM 11237 TaxID=1120923 RepID=A0A0D6PL51_9PROT|nr:PrsW family glutamic-type intramembrane protease [Acidocella aminolytica]GAN82101.1 hypothetical protein Aam_153_013 [Acidocella aminolytica 101 = DSM 11237]GBQ32477.1 hypothetical protein AA11237_0163 [Acidocella aminolytica 101 = DSM 11237]SHE74509.1 Protease prsW family protein [Acidocella aminolytica 101 = DSM 11237]